MIIAIATISTTACHDDFNTSKKKPVHKPCKPATSPTPCKVRKNVTPMTTAESSDHKNHQKSNWEIFWPQNPFLLSWRSTQMNGFFNLGILVDSSSSNLGDLVPQISCFVPQQIPPNHPPTVMTTTPRTTSWYILPRLNRNKASCRCASIQPLAADLRIAPVDSLIR